MDEKPESESERRRKKGMSPELRRFLGPARSLQGREENETPSAEDVESDIEQQPESELPPEYEVEEERPRPKARPARQEYTEAEQVGGSGRSVVLAPAADLSRVIQMQTVALIIGGILLLGGVFYVGKKFEYLKYLITAANKPKLTDTSPDKFPNLSAEELIEQGLASERLGRWSDAIERFMSAKRKNLAY